MAYAHFTLKTRRELQDLYRCGKSLSEIARRLGMHRSTLSREIERNGCGNRKYDAWYAHKQAMGRKKRGKACRPGERHDVKLIFGRVTGDYLFDPYHKIRRFIGIDESFRLIRDRRYLLYGGDNDFRKPLTPLQKLLRRRDLRNRLRLHDWENRWRTPRRWELVIRLSHHKVQTQDIESVACDASRYRHGALDHDRSENTTSPCPRASHHVKGHRGTHGHRNDIETQYLASLYHYASVCAYHPIKTVLTINLFKHLWVQSVFFIPEWKDPISWGKTQYFASLFSAGFGTVHRHFLFRMQYLAS